MANYTSNGYYLLTVTMGSGKEFSFPIRGYKAKSWLEFETSLGLKHSLAELEEHEYNKLHWTSSDITVESPALPKASKNTKTTKKVAVVPEQPVEVPKKRKTKPKGTLEDFL